MLREIMCPQRKARMVPMVVTGTGTAAIGEGQFQASLTDNGVGDYTIAMNEPFHRIPVIVSTPETSETIIQLANIAIDSFDVLCFEVDGTTPKDAKFNLLVLGFDAADEY